MSSADTFSDFLGELRADRKSKSFDEMAQRLIAEREIRNSLSKLKDQGFVIQENLDETIGFDFLIRKDDKEVLMVLEYKKKRFSLSKALIVSFHRTLIPNPLSEGIIVAWTLRPEYPSIYLSALELNRMLTRDERTFNFSKEVQPLKSCLFSVFRKPESLVSELKPKEKTRAVGEDKMMVSLTFRENIEKMFKNLQLKKYRLDHKKKALRAFSEKDLDRLKRVFELTLDGKFERGQLKNCLKKISEAKEE